MGTKIEQPTIDDIKGLDGKCLGMLNEKQNDVYDFFFLHGRKFGVSLQVDSEAPKVELEAAKSKQQSDEIVSQYPNIISVHVA